MDKILELALLEGEGLKVEFKERVSNLDREIVAFANNYWGNYLPWSGGFWRGYRHRDR